MNRVSFLVDGFNIYHSAIEAKQDLNGASTLWLNLPSLLSSCLTSLGREANLEEIYYFSALAKHRDARSPGTTARHRKYIDCLIASGVKVELGRFKPKMVLCKTCNTSHTRHEEKETDVALSIKVLELFHLDACDTIVLITGDTDLVPVVGTAKALFPAKEVCFGFPYKRKSKELAKITSNSFLIRKERYPVHQFSDPYVLPSGRSVSKPPSW